MKRTRIKICGIRDLETARAAAGAGADAVGFVFHPASPRFVEPADAWEIVGSLPPFVSTVGLFVDLPLEKFCDIEEQCPTDLSQLHGSEDEELVSECGPNIIKAIRFALTIFLIVVVWKEVHWSVAVSLILITFSIEGIALSLDIINRALRAHIQAERDLCEEVEKDINAADHAH